MSGGYQDLLDVGIESLEHGEVELLGAALVQIRRQFPGLRHLTPRTRNFLGVSFPGKL